MTGCVPARRLMQVCAQPTYEALLDLWWQGRLPVSCESAAAGLIGAFSDHCLPIVTCSPIATQYQGSQMLMQKQGRAQVCFCLSVFPGERERETVFVQSC